LRRHSQLSMRLIKLALDGSLAILAAYRLCNV